MLNPHVHVPYHRLEEYFQFIKDHRINLEIYFASQSLDTINEAEVIKLKERLDYNPSLSIHAPFMDLSPGAVDSKIRDITIGRFSHVLTIAEILKPKVIVFHSGYEKSKYAHRVDVWLEGSMKTWPILLNKAVAMNIKIAVENIFEDDPSNLELLMKEMGSGHFGVCFDTGHFNLFSKIPLKEWLMKLLPYIIELHLHDNDRTFDAHRAIGDGTFDFDTLFSMLKDKDLVYTVEGHTKEDVAESIKRLQKYI